MNKKIAKQVITTHIGGDFDGLASMLALSLLYPQAVPVLCGSIEKRLKNQFLPSHPLGIDFLSIKDIDIDAVEHLIVADTFDFSKIGGFYPLTQSSQVKITLYDHHKLVDELLKKASENPSHFEYFHFSTGACTTPLVLELKKRTIAITPNQALLLWLGILVDTGSLCYEGTSPPDLEALHWLLENGASPPLASFFLHSLPSLALNEIARKLEHNLEIIYTEKGKSAYSVISHDEYVDDVATMASGIMMSHGLVLLILGVETHGRTSLIFRSTTPEIDVNKMAQKFSGGGHATAASGKVVAMPHHQLRQLLKNTILGDENLIQPVSMIMIRHVKTLSPSEPLANAKDLFDQYHFSNIPVVDNGILVGTVPHSLFLRAERHNLLHQNIQDLMVTDYLTSKPYKPIHEVGQIIASYNQSFVPIIDDEKKLVGIVTRSHVLQHLFDSESGIKENGRRLQQDFRKKMEEQIPSHLYEMLRTIGMLADQRKEKAYLVGGPVRDLLLRRATEDLDIVVDGNAISLAQAAKEILGGKLIVHHRFNNATLVMNSISLDFVTCRMEYYPSPGHLPVVETGSIRIDLYRRDFTLNAMALDLTGSHFGTLLDPYSGLEDVKNSVIRILHNLSFVEDPTRILRALRFKCRLNFHLSPNTQLALKKAVKEKFLLTVSKQRIMREIIYLLKEPDPGNHLRELKANGIEKNLSILPPYNPQLQTMLNRAREIIGWAKITWPEKQFQTKWVFLPIVFKHLFLRHKRASMDVLGLQGEDLRYFKKAIKDIRILENIFNSFLENWKSLMIEKLKHADFESILHALVHFPDREKELKLYLLKLVEIQPMVTGKDLIAIGYQPGQYFTQILNDCFHRQLESENPTKETLLALIPPAEKTLPPLQQNLS